MRCFAFLNSLSRENGHYASGLILPLKEYQEADKNYRTEREEIDKGNERQADPNRFFLIGNVMKDVCKACDAFLVDSIADNEKEKKDDHA